jgi:hypothetical protein
MSSFYDDEFFTTACETNSSSESSRYSISQSKRYGNKFPYGKNENRFSGFVALHEGREAGCYFTTGIEESMRSILKQVEDLKQIIGLQDWADCVYLFDCAEEVVTILNNKDSILQEKYNLREKLNKFRELLGQIQSFVKYFTDPKYQCQRLELTYGTKYAFLVKQMSQCMNDFGIGAGMTRKAEFREKLIEVIIWEGLLVLILIVD